MTEQSNRVRNCLYARWFTPQEKRLLRKSSPDSRDEIAALRTFAGRITCHLLQKEPAEYSSEDLKLLTVLVRIAAGIGALQRGNASLQGRDAGVESSIQAAIASMDEDWSLA